MNFQIEGLQQFSEEQKALKELLTAIIYGQDTKEKREKYNLLYQQTNKIIENYLGNVSIAQLDEVLESLFPNKENSIEERDAFNFCLLIQALLFTGLKSDPEKISDVRFDEEYQLLLFKMNEWFFTNHDTDSHDKSYAINDLVAKAGHSIAIRNHLAGFDDYNDFFANDETNRLQTPQVALAVLLNFLNDILTTVILYIRLGMKKLPNFMLIQIAAIVAMINKYQFNIDLESLINDQFKFNIAETLLGDTRPEANEELKNKIIEMISGYADILMEYCNSLQNNK